MLLRNVCKRVPLGTTPIVAWHEVPLEFGHFEDGLQGGERSVARAIGEEEIEKINEASVIGGMTHHVNGGRPGVSGT